jgi:radical SAM family uncharacterized protein
MKVVLEDSLLLTVEKPARYTGNEWNMVVKDPDSVAIRYAFCFPDVYEVGMSHLGMKILYHCINMRDDAYCERVFAPWFDMEDKMRAMGMPLFSLETRTALSDFDFIGFTLQYEMSFTNIINMLDLSAVSIFSKDRKEGDPFVMAGGPCACNPEPLADFFDFFVIGDGEEIIHEILDEYKGWKEAKEERMRFLERVARIQGVYVPSMYDVSYNDDGTIASVVPNNEIAPVRPKRRIVKDLDKIPFPTAVIVPYIGAVHDRVILELFRGCVRGCRFCQAGFIYRPVRERSVENLTSLAKKSICETGYEEISMMSLSTSDYSGLPELSENLIEFSESKNIGLAVPSLRVDNFSLGLMDKISKVRKSGLTFAPEAGSQRLRDVINKGVTDENLISSVCIAVAGGWSAVKLYFMMGLPTETMDDIDAIAELAFRLVDSCRNIGDGEAYKNLKISLSVACFIPKPFTPFQWEPQDTMLQLQEKQKYLREKIKRRSKKIELNWHDSETSLLEAVVARGDRRVGQALYLAWKKGCRFDSWKEHFKYRLWMEAVAEAGINADFYAYRKREHSEILPWDHIDIGVDRSFLENESIKADEAELTRNCANGCMNCGAGEYKAGICLKKK